MQFGVLELLMLAGSLGLFIYGMKVLSEGLQKVAGRRLRLVVKAMTGNRFRGVLTGFTTTAIVQYSSVTTVMVVSFVNAGLLNLRQSIPVIMGANIGTTVKALVFSWVGLSALPLTSVALPLIGLSFPLLFMRRSSVRGITEFLMGTALLFMGLDLLKEHVPVLAPETLAFLRGVGDMGPLSWVLFVIVGAAMAILVQSSSVALALTMVLCDNGTIGFEMAAAIVLGENIGTTLAANLAALVGNAWAKRAARAHFLFNLFGVAWALLLFTPYLYGLDQLVTYLHGVSPYADPGAVKWGLSYLHISFNILNTALFIQAIPFLERAVTWMVPTRSTDDTVYRLEHIEDALAGLSPELSLLEARKEIVRFGKLTHTMLGHVRVLLVEKDAREREALLDRIARGEETTDRIEVEVGKYLTKVGSEVRSEEISARIQALLAIVGDLERVADIFFQMSKALERKSGDRLWFTPEQRMNLMEMLDLLERAFTIMERNLEAEAEAVRLDEAVEVEQLINQKRDLLRRTHLKSIEAGDYNIRSGLIYNDLFSSCEKVGDHLINVSEALAGEV
ncbi:MAG: Na/Pi cotransporter family protein [Flavobacteriales bacterium]|nr:Na/Pi cotransporter family protein [Flavobacteriales bacterium]